VVSDAWHADRIVRNIALAVERARGRAVPVIWLQHSDANLVHGSPQWQWVPALVPAEGETLVHKHYNSSFEQTELEAELARLGATHIALAGCATNWCVRATAYAALERGYDLTLVSDAHTTETMRSDSGATIDAECVINDLNAVMSWLHYPGRRCGTVKAEAIDFGAT
jgi:nicotinamidase-related amidase